MNHEVKYEVPREWLECNTTVTLSKTAVNRIIDSLEAAIENAQELLDEHLRAHGETTTKNKSIATLYRDEMRQCHIALAYLLPTKIDEDV